MEKYVPPFSITNEILDRVVIIMKKVGKFDNYFGYNKMPLLRKNNMLLSIQSSLAIEANSLNIDDVFKITENNYDKYDDEVQEVMNAYEAYSMIKKIDPYSINEFKRIHGIMTNKLVRDSGKFRNGNEGVFDENGNCIHICPPPEQVDYLMKELFKWINDSDINLLISSCVFHYEMVFIHPFSDGNGRMARLWQNILLTKFDRVFEYLPIENKILEHQQEYYKVINYCDIKGDSTKFIEFMLEMINESIDDVLNKLNNVYIDSRVKKLINVMEPSVIYTTNELLSLLKLKSRVSFRENYLIPGINSGFIKMYYPDSPTNRNQGYYINYY